MWEVGWAHQICFHSCCWRTGRWYLNILKVALHMSSTWAGKILISEISKLQCQEVCFIVPVWSLHLVSAVEQHQPKKTTERQLRGPKWRKARIKIYPISHPASDTVKHHFYHTLFTKTDMKSSQVQGKRRHWSASWQERDQEPKECLGEEIALQPVLENTTHHKEHLSVVTAHTHVGVLSPHRGGKRACGDGSSVHGHFLFSNECSSGDKGAGKSVATKATPSQWPLCPLFNEFHGHWEGGV